MKTPHILPLAAIIGLLFSHPTRAFEINSDEYTQTEPQAAHPLQLQQVNVRGKRMTPPSVERKQLEQIQTEMIRDNKDLVRYTPDVGLSDSGRHQKGFAMRGVEGNRVGISIDGVNLPDPKKIRCMPATAISTAHVWQLTLNWYAKSILPKARIHSTPAVGHSAAA